MNIILINSLDFQMVRIIQNYTLHQIIGQGAYGKVYRATNKNDTLEYAVKVIQVKKFKQNKKLQECTVNEINILTNIEHNEHIIKYIDMLKTPNNFYFIYEYCDGGTLENQLKKQRFLSEREAMKVFKQLIEAFQILNKYNIMHRDLKPDNIFFHNGYLKLGDFGFCKSLQKAQMTKTMLGSPIYMAPEILRGEIYSTKADIWSLGVVLYQMLYGLCPFQSSTIPSLIQMLKETDLKFPKDPVVSDKTKRLLSRLLTKDPAKRIEWMEVLRINITNDGTLVQDKKSKVSLIMDENDTLNSVRTLKQCTEEDISPTSLSPTTTPNIMSKQNATTNATTTANSISSRALRKQQYKPNYIPTSPTGHYAEESPYLKKKAFLEKKKISQQSFSNIQILKERVLKEHSDSIKALYLAVQMLKSNDYNCANCGYIVLKKIQDKLAILRDQIANKPGLTDIVSVINYELKEISAELSKHNFNDNINNWKQILRKNQDFKKLKNIASIINFIESNNKEEGQY